MLTKIQLAQKRTKRALKRKREIRRRVLCHGNKMSCEYHSHKIEPKVVIKKRKLSIWQRIKEWFLRLTK